VEDARLPGWRLEGLRDAIMNVRHGRGMKYVIEP
jgi:hypothetical protein